MHHKLILYLFLIPFHALGGFGNMMKYEGPRCLEGLYYELQCTEGPYGCSNSVDTCEDFANGKSGPYDKKWDMFSFINVYHYTDSNCVSKRWEGRYRIGHFCRYPTTLHNSTIEVKGNNYTLGVCYSGGFRGALSRNYFIGMLRNESTSTGLKFSTTDEWYNLSTTVMSESSIVPSVHQYTITIASLGCLINCFKYTWA